MYSTVFRGDFTFWSFWVTLGVYNSSHIPSIATVSFVDSALESDPHAGFELLVTLDDSEDVLHLCGGHHFLFVHGHAEKVDALYRLLDVCSFVGLNVDESF